MNNLKQIKRLLASFPKENRFYWIEALIKQGKLSIGEAGYLIYKGILK